MPKHRRYHVTTILTALGLLFAAACLSWATLSSVSGDKLVASGTVTQANMKISPVDGTAFVDFTAADVLTTKLGHKLQVCDSTGKCIQGYIKAAGTGETLDVELVTNGDFASSTGWTPGTGWSISGGEALRDGTVGASPLYRSITISDGLLIKVVFDVVSIASGSIQSFIAGSIFSESYTTTGTKTSYRTYRTGTTNGLYSANADGHFDNFSMKQVLTPSATGATITTTKGGSTFNWANKNSAFNYNDSSGYTYRIYKDSRLVQVATGSVTQANTRLDMTSDNAFAWLEGVDLSAYQDGKHYICLYNATGGYGACGWISATAPAGETLDSELISAWSNNPTYSYETFASAGQNVTSAVNTTLYGSCVANAVATQYSLYKYSRDFTLVSGTIPQTYWGSSDGFATPTTFTSGAGLTNTYRTALFSSHVKFGHWTPTGVATSFSTVNESLKMVTDPPSIAVKIVSSDLSTRAWPWKHASFNPNDAGGITYRIYYSGSP